jgi:hypothetical protein
MHRLTRIIFFLLVFSLFACGSDGISGSYEVTGIGTLADDIRIGEGARVEVFFESKVEADGEPDSVELVVALSPSLGYQLGTARIYDDSLDDSDSREPDQIVECTDGRTFLVFRFRGNELDDRSLAGASTFGMKFEAVGISVNPFAQIYAAAGESQEFSCDADFPFEDHETIAVTP